MPPLNWALIQDGTIPGSKPRASALWPWSRAATEAVAAPVSFPGAAGAGKGAVEGMDWRREGGAAFSGSGGALKAAKGEGGAEAAGSGAAGVLANGDSGAALNKEGMTGGCEGAEKGEVGADIAPKGEGGGLARAGAEAAISKKGVGGRELAGGCEGSRRGGRTVEAKGDGADSAREKAEGGAGGSGWMRLWKGEAGPDGVEGAALNKELKGLAGAASG